MLCYGVRLRWWQLNRNRPRAEVSGSSDAAWAAGGGEKKWAGRASGWYRASVPGWAGG